MARQDFRFVHRLRVRWAEVDRQGIVFNGHYLTYFDVGITEYYRALGHPYPGGLAAHGTDLYVRKAEIEYEASAGYDDEIDVCVRVERLGRSSFDFRVEIHRGGDLLVAGRVVYVNADPATRKSAPLPDFLRDAIRAFERTPPAEARAAAAAS
ncbi:MAG TPA: thioesterase family protein [Burkholderiales bacterium]|nr:thioesterase family protein [Burkholderiales bacterium]